MKPTRFLSVKEVGAILRIHERTVRKKIYAGEIPGHFMLGSMHFIDEEEFFKGLKDKAIKPNKTVSKLPNTRTDRHGLLD